MNVYENGPWRNRHHQPYEQYCYEDELPEMLARLFKVYGSAFDDDWQYRRVKHPKSQRQVIARRPHWMDKTTGGWYLEKAKHAGAGANSTEASCGFYAEGARRETVTADSKKKFLISVLDPELIYAVKLSAPHIAPVIIAKNRKRKE